MAVWGTRIKCGYLAVCGRFTYIILVRKRQLSSVDIWRCSLCSGSAENAVYAFGLREVCGLLQDVCRATAVQSNGQPYIIPFPNLLRGMNNIVFCGSSQMFCEICRTCNDNVTDFLLKRRNCFNSRDASGEFALSRVVTTDTLRCEQMREYSHLRYIKR